MSGFGVGSDFASLFVDGLPLEHECRKVFPSLVDNCELWSWKMVVFFFLKKKRGWGLFCFAFHFYFSNFHFKRILVCFLKKLELTMLFHIYMQQPSCILRCTRRFS
jgi:hypothetical protein